MVVDDDTNIDGWGKLDLVVVGMKMIWPETPWWEDDAVRINDARADARERPGRWDDAAVIVGVMVVRCP